MDDPTRMKRPETTEIAGVNTGIGANLAPYIGELSPDPRQTSTYRQRGRDDSYVLQMYRNTLRDEQVYATLNQRLDAAVDVGWTVEPGGTKQQDKRAAKDLEEQLQKLKFDTICRQMLFGVWFGYSVAECMWKADGSRVTLADIRVRACDRFRWDDDRTMLLRTWQAPHGEPVPDHKFWVLARGGEHGDVPHGPGLAYWCYWPSWMRRNGHRFWAVAMEKFGMPTPKGKYPPGDEASKNALLDVLRQLSAGAGVAIPEGQDIDLLYSLRSMSGDFKAFPEYFDRMISKVILGQSSTTEQGPWRGTAEVQKDVRDEAVKADCRLLGESFQDVVSWITAWNHPTAAPPKVIRDASPPEDLDQRAEREERVSRMSGLRPTKKHVEETYGGEWEPKPMPDPAAPGDTDPDDPGAADNAQLAEPDDDAVDREIKDLLAGEGWEPLMLPSINPILAAVREAGDLETLRKRIDEGDLFQDVDSAKLADVLGNMMFSAETSGEI